MNFQAVTTLAGLEIRQRVRSTRWRVSLGVLFGLVSMIVLGTLYLTVALGGTFDGWSDYALDIVLILVLFIGLVGSPTISATSINGDRRDSTLAVVQATPITAWEVTLGKFLGAWAASLALVGVALPYLILAVLVGPTSIVAGIGSVIVLALLMGCYCAVGLGFSALTSRPAASAMLTQATVLMLLFGLPLAFGISVPAVSTSEKVTVTEWDYTQGAGTMCREVPGTREFAHTEYSWWLLAPNPAVIVGDVIGAGADWQGDDEATSAGVLGLLAYGVAAARQGPEIVGARCPGYQSDHHGSEFDGDRYIGHTWYLGLAVTIALAAGGLAIAAHRLQVPARRLARGVRIA